MKLLSRPVQREEVFELTVLDNPWCTPPTDGYPQRLQ